MLAIQTGYYQGGYHAYDPNTSTLVSDYTVTDTPAPVYRNGMNSQDVYESSQNTTTGNTYSAPVIGSQASVNSDTVPVGFGVFFRHDGTVYRISSTNST